MELRVGDMDFAGLQVFEFTFVAMEPTRLQVFNVTPVILEERRNTRRFRVDQTRRSTRIRESLRCTKFYTILEVVSNLIRSFGDGVDLGDHGCQRMEVNFHPPDCHVALVVH